MFNYFSNSSQNINANLEWTFLTCKSTVHLCKSHTQTWALCRPVKFFYTRQESTIAISLQNSLCAQGYCQAEKEKGLAQTVTVNCGKQALLFCVN